ncbi:ABC transporter substrate-binding protein [Lacticaseibacillus camelliae]|nr:ABC transporter substrate-binding protein [Lacticaseibacillus camelliae]
MKKGTLLKIVGATLFAATLGLAGCSSNSSSDSDKTTGGADKTLAVIIPSSDHGWQAGVNYYANQEVKKLGLKNYKIVTSSSVNEQASQIDDMISQGVGAIVLQPQTDEVSVAAKKIVNEKIPLVVFDRKVDADYTAYVAGSNPQIGEKSAEKIGDELDGKGTVAILNVPSSGSVSAERTDGFKKVMKDKYPNIKLVEMTADDFTQEKGLKAATDMLQSNKQVDGIFSIDDESSIGILQAIKDAGRKDIKIISGAGGDQSYFKKIDESTDITCFTATYSPSMIGDSIKLANDAMNGKKIKRNNIIAPTIVTKDNVSKHFDSKSPY